MATDSTLAEDAVGSLATSLAALEVGVSAERICFVSSKDDCQRICKELAHESLLALDLEGIDLGRTGEICILQLGCRDGRVYLFDICSLQQDAFTSDGLRLILENEAIRKIIFDVRSDCDALKHQYGVTLAGALDLQVLYVTVRAKAASYLPGMKKVLEDTLSRSEKMRLDGLKNQGKDLFAPEKGGRYEVWKDRPLNPILVEYASEDVRQLFKIYDRWIGRSQKLVKGVVAKSKQRILNTIDQPAAYHSGALRDF
jgi:exonuclease 3'-5' domain-containing protein 1